MKMISLGEVALVGSWSNFCACLRAFGYYRDGPGQSHALDVRSRLWETEPL